MQSVHTLCVTCSARCFGLTSSNRLIQTVVSRHTVCVHQMIAARNAYWFAKQPNKRAEFMPILNQRGNCMASPLCECSSYRTLAGVGEFVTHRPLLLLSLGIWNLDCWNSEQHLAIFSAKLSGKSFLWKLCIKNCSAFFNIKVFSALKLVLKLWNERKVGSVSSVRTLWIAYGSDGREMR